MRANPIVTVLARAFVAGEANAAAMAERGGRAVGRQWRWLLFVATRFVAAHEHGTRPRFRDAAAFIRNDKGFQRAERRLGEALRVADLLTDAAVMQPAPAAVHWGVPAITNAADMADFLSLHPSELDWLADLKGICRSPRLKHYWYRSVPKRSGGVRLLEAPKADLKAVQRRVLSAILDRIPPHNAAHGFVKGRSIRTFTAPHTGQFVLLRMDLENFFTSVTGPQIQGIFRTAGYPESVAGLLSGLCTHARSRREIPHLPQGAATSPALANIASWRMDCRLTGLAAAAGATYTRYADDLAFSGGEEFARGVARFSLHVAAIVLEEGFRVNHRKTRIMRRGVRQHLAGLVVNEQQNIPRADYDRLKAILTNCIRSGPEGQNREGRPRFREHLEGRIGFVESVNPERGRRLRELFRRIVWRADTP